MLESVEAYTGPTYLSYHGHGQIERAAANSSVAHVAAHERRHITSYYRKALALGAEVKNPRIHYDLRFRDGKLVAIGGKASATILSPQDEVQISSLGRETASRQANSDSGSQPNEMEDQNSPDKLIRELESIGHELEVNREKLESRSARETSPAMKQRLAQKQRVLDQKLAEIDRLLAQVQTLKGAEMTEDLLTAGAEMYDLAYRTVTAAHGGESAQLSLVYPNASPTALRIRFNTIV